MKPPQVIVKEWPSLDGPTAIRSFVMGLDAPIRADAVALLTYTLHHLEKVGALLELGEGLFQARFRQVSIFFAIQWPMWPLVTVTVIGGTLTPFTTTDPPDEPRIAPALR